MVFVAASWLLIITPGPDMIYVLTRGISQGRSAGIISALGVTTGILVHTSLSAFGLAMILMTSSLAFMLVKTIGACYLVFLGVRAILDKNAISLKSEKCAFRRSSLFLQGVLSNVLNPKVALFFLAFLPQFAFPENGHVPLQMATLGLVFAFFGMIWLVFLGYFAGKAGQWIASRRSFTGKIRWVTGSLLIGLGARLVFMDSK